MPKGPARVLVIDDDPSYTRKIARTLLDEGYEVQYVHSADDAMDITRTAVFDLVIVDMRMPWGKFFDPADTDGEERTGLALAKAVRKLQPRARLLAHSLFDDPAIREWFATRGGGGWLRKTGDPEALLRMVNRLLRPSVHAAQVFLVHGRDDATLQEVRSFLRDGLGLDLVVLRDKPSRGMSLIEKFEHYAAKADLAIVLITPDDTGYLTSEPESARLRPRANVVFEMGYFLGSMRRVSGRVVVLFKQPVELPSDMTGVVLTDVSNGIASASGEIRRECSEFIRDAGGVDKPGR